MVAGQGTLADKQSLQETARKEVRVYMQCIFKEAGPMFAQIIGRSMPQINSKGLSRALRSLVKFTGQENPPKSSSKKSGDSELD